jgi:hypothetical protein
VTAILPVAASPVAPIAVSAASVAALVGTAPGGLAQLAIGQMLAAQVVGRNRDGHWVLKTGNGVLTLSSQAVLQVGSSVNIEVQANGTLLLSLAPVSRSEPPPAQPAPLDTVTVNSGDPQAAAAPQPGKAQAPALLPGMRLTALLLRTEPPIPTALAAGPGVATAAPLAATQLANSVPLTGPTAWVQAAPVVATPPITSAGTGPGSPGASHFPPGSPAALAAQTSTVNPPSPGSPGQGGAGLATPATPLPPARGDAQSAALAPSGRPALPPTYRPVPALVLAVGEAAPHEFEPARSPGAATRILATVIESPGSGHLLVRAKDTIWPSRRPAR